MYRTLERSGPEMPPIADKQLEARILKAAEQLWRTDGEQGLTLRSVAREAGTTTPTLYKRFRNKEALRLAMARHFRNEAEEDFLKAVTLKESYRRFFAYIEAHLREYDLIRSYWGHFSAAPRFGRSWVLSRLVEQFGGEPEEYSTVYDTIFLLCHGASTLMSVAMDPDVLNSTRDMCIQVCDRMIENAVLLREKA